MPLAFTNAREIRIRIGDIALTHADVLGKVEGEECPIPQDGLPAFQVLTRKQLPTMTNRDRRTMRRIFDWCLFCYRICNGTPREFWEAYEVTEEYVETVTDALAPSWPNFILSDDNGLVGIKEAILIPDTGPMYIDWAGEQYGAVRGTIEVEYYRPAKN